MKFLFLCTGNSCRSILSEVLFNSRAPEGWVAYSAGSKPSGQVHPLTLETLHNLGLSTEGLSSKSIDACEQYQPDVVITVWLHRKRVLFILAERSRRTGACLIRPI